MLRFLTSGESHGPTLVAILDGVPAGLRLDLEQINSELRRRQQGYGRGARQKIETDSAEFVGGIRHGITTGAPLAIMVRNRDWDNWRHVMSIEPVDFDAPEVKEQLNKKAIGRFRPGHADIAGTLKFRQSDIRDVLERASARETAARVAVGAVCEQLLKQFGVRLVSHIISVAGTSSGVETDSMPLAELEQRVLASEMFCADEAATDKMKEAIKSAWQEGDSLGGIVEVLADGLPVGLGSYTQWDEKIDGQLAQAMMSIQAMKAVEVGEGVTNVQLPGSQVHDALYPSDSADSPNGSQLPFMRKTNRAGGIEGGMTNGSRLKVRAYMKPIPTIRKGLPSVSFPQYDAETAHYERSDVCAVPAASVVAKAMVAFVLARALLSKFGGDTITDIKLSVDNFKKWCSNPRQAITARNLNVSPPPAPEMELE
ncbi:MAG TPA: chorismate synthase [Candidatus Obscuribacterales bacterium]